MKIRIGNDIKLDVYLSKENIKDQINIKKIQCYLINTTQDPYPACPSTKYDVNTCGVPKYHVMPCEKRTDNYFWRCDNYWLKAPYDGFGVNPEWDKVYVKNHGVCFTNKYLASCNSTADPNRIEVLFPAKDQRQTGVYDLLIIADIFEPGYSDDNTKRITVDYANVFEIVSHSSEADSNDNTTISVGYPSESDVTSVCIMEPSITRVFVGNYGFVQAKALPENARNNQLQWEIDDTHFELISGDGNVMSFVGKCVPDITNPEYTGKAKVFVKNKPDVFAEVDITVTNYADKLMIGCSRPSGSSLNYNEELIINPFVKTQNGCIIQDYKNAEGENLYAVEFNEVVSDYVTVDRFEDGSVSIINTNNTSSDKDISITFTSVIPTESGEYPTEIVRYTLKPVTDSASRDDYVVSGVYNEDTNNIDLTRQFGGKVSVDVSDLDKLNWKLY